MSAGVVIAIVAALVAATPFVLVTLIACWVKLSDVLDKWVSR